MTLIAMVALMPALAACAGTTGASPSAPAGGTAAPAASVAPAPGSACLDVAQLGDLGETVASAMQTVTDDLKAGNVDGATTAAGTAAGALRALADYVATAQPQAAQQLRGAADSVEKATASFPAGSDLVGQAQQDLNEAFKLARTAGCPS